MVFLLNPPVEDAAGGEADKSLRLPREMRSLFLWGYAQKIIHLRRINPRNIKHMPVVIFFACLASSPEGYAGQVILSKNPHFWIDTD
jgi:hypothetical protein